MEEDDHDDECNGDGVDDCYDIEDCAADELMMMMLIVLSMLMIDMMLMLIRW